MTEADRSTEYARLLAENRRYTDAFDRSALTAAPLSKLAVVACMDARLDVEETLGLRTGDAHIIRNAGGLVTDDVIRSLSVSQRLLGTEEIVVVMHDGCGLHGASEYELGAFDDLEATLRASLARLQASPELPARDHIRGFIFDPESGTLREIAPG
jgi:carbonic anhydrase